MVVYGLQAGFVTGSAAHELTADSNIAATTLKISRMCHSIHNLYFHLRSPFVCSIHSLLFSIVFAVYVSFMLNIIYKHVQ